MSRWKAALIAALMPAAAAPAQATKPGPAKAAAPAPVEAPVEKPPASLRALDQARAARGRLVYQRFCISCHGEEGDGRGYSAQWMDPRPRDFTRAIFKCRSTPSGTLPVDEDLLRSLKEGLDHTNMPSWAVLGEANLRDVIEYLKTFSPRWKEEVAGDPLAYAREPADDAASRRKGQAVWNAQACFNCHGQGGKGDGPSVSTLFDDWGNHLVPFDFTSSPHRKCGNTDRDLYRTFLTGLSGTPMPSYAETMSPEEAWHLVHYLKTLQVKTTAQHLFGFSMGR